MAAVDDTPIDLLQRGALVDGLSDTRAASIDLRAAPLVAVPLLTVGAP